MGVCACVCMHAITMLICIILIIIKGIFTIKFLWQQFTPRALLFPLHVLCLKRRDVGEWKWLTSSCFCPHVESITGFKSKRGMWRVRVKGITLWKLMASDKNKLLKDRVPFHTEQALILTVWALVGTRVEEWGRWLFQSLTTYPRKSYWNQLPGILQVFATDSAKDASTQVHQALTYWFPDLHRYS